MAKLPAVTARQVLRVLKRAGFVEDRQKGSCPKSVTGDKRFSINEL